MCHHSNAYWTNQYGNPDAIEAHYELTGTEICTDFASLDMSSSRQHSGNDRRSVPSAQRALPHSGYRRRPLKLGSLRRYTEQAPYSRRWLEHRPPLCRFAKIDDVVLISERGPLKRARNPPRHTDCLWALQWHGVRGHQAVSARMPGLKHPTDCSVPGPRYALPRHCLRSHLGGQA